MYWGVELLGWVDGLASSAGWSRSQVLRAMCVGLRALDVCVVEVGDVDELGGERVVEGLVWGSRGGVVGAAPFCDGAADGGGRVVGVDVVPEVLVSGGVGDDDLFSERRRREAVNELFAMGTGRGPHKVSDAARVRAMEQYNRLGEQHWVRRSAADDDDVVVELLGRLSLSELERLLVEVRELRVAEEEARASAGVVV